jgi:hypothetical protein
MWKLIVLYRKTPPSKRTWGQGTTLSTPNFCCFSLVDAFVLKNPGNFWSKFSSNLRRRQKIGFALSSLGIFKLSESLYRLDGRNQPTTMGIEPTMFFGHFGETVQCDTVYPLVI